MRRTILAAVLGLGTLGTAPAFAGGPGYGYKQVTCYETRVVYETRQVAYTKEVTKYDHCGKPYTVCVTCYKTVEVAVEKTVPVTKWVKVCDY